MTEPPRIAPGTGSDERRKRVLGLPARAGSLSSGTKAALFVGALAALVVLVAWLDPTPSLRHVRVAVLSGSPTGNYFATVDRSPPRCREGGATAQRPFGRVGGKRPAADRRREALRRPLRAGAGRRRLSGPARPGIIGRLPRPESLVVLGRDADRIRPRRT